MSSTPSPLDSMILLLVSITTVEGHVKLSGSDATISLSNIKCGADLTNKRFTCTGSFTPQRDGRISEVYIRFLSGSTGGGSINPVAELSMIHLDSSPDMNVISGGTYRVLITVTWQ